MNRLTRYTLGTMTDSEIEQWLTDGDPDLRERLNRLRLFEDEYRLDLARREVPLHLGGQEGNVVSIFRGLPCEADIRPGDWVALDINYAKAHARGNTAHVASMDLVPIEDVFWAGTDANEFFYLPQAWRKQDVRRPAYLRDLSEHMLATLQVGEQWRLRENKTAVERLHRAMATREACQLALSSHVHGQSHWDRVKSMSLAICRQQLIDPTIACLFSHIHDSHRSHDGFDLEHGANAARFVLSCRQDLLHFLTDSEVAKLAHACEQHSEGLTSQDEHVASCWDADRLDLARPDVETEPSAAYMSTEFARRPEVIEAAMALSTRDIDGAGYRDTARALHRHRGHG